MNVPIKWTINNKTGNQLLMNKILSLIMKSFEI